MSELRKDPVTGRWVIIAEERSKRPSDFPEAPPRPEGALCPFCEGNERHTPPEIVAYRAPDSRPDREGWWVRVVPNRYPALSIEGALDKRGVGLYDRMNGVGAHEVVIETNRHETSLTGLEPGHVRDVMWAYRERLGDLSRDHRLVHALVFKNVGAAAGATLEHTHSQIIATPTVPATTAAELTGSSDYFGFRGRCLFCDMLEQERELAERVVVETERFVAFAPYASRFPFETWILPRAHRSHFEEVEDGEVEDLARVLLSVLGRIENLLDAPPYNYMLHTSPFDLGFLSYYHWHLEIIPRLTDLQQLENLTPYSATAYDVTLRAWHYNENTVPKESPTVALPSAGEPRRPPEKPCRHLPSWRF